MTDAPDTIQAQTADGVIHEFPAGTPDAVVDKVIHAYMAANPQPQGPSPAGKVRNPNPGPTAGIAPPPQHTPGYQQAAAMADQQMSSGSRLHAAPTDAALSVVNGMTFNNADRVAGGISAAQQYLNNTVFGSQGQPSPQEAYEATRDVARRRGDAYAQSHPVTNFALGAVGGIPIGEGAGGFIAKAATPLAAVGRSIAAGGAVGAAYGAGGNKANPVVGALEGGAVGATVGGVVPVLAQGARSLVNGVPKVGQALANGTRAALPDAQERLAQMGVQLTPGQIMGGAAKVMEDAATSTPIIGPAIAAARQNANETFNKGILNQALGKIGQKLSDATDAGHAAIKEAGDRIGAAYDAALPKGGVTADPQLATDLQQLPQVQGTMTQDAKDRVASFLNSRLQSRLDANGGDLTGENYQAVQSDLKREIATQGKRGDPEGIGLSLQHVSDSLQDAARRQNPRFAVQLDKADAAWALLTRAEKAAGMAGAENGVFTPAQYANAVKTGDNTIRNRGFARGDALGQATADAAKGVMSSKVPDSGTATRGMVGLLLGGAGGAAGGPLGIAGTVAGLGAGRMAYKAANSAAQRYLTRPVTAAATASTKSINQPMGSTTARLVGQAQQGAAQLNSDAVQVQYVQPNGQLSPAQ